MNMMKYNKLSGVVLVSCWLMQSLFAQLDPILQEFDKNSDGKLNGEERKKIQERYLTVADKDNDGKVSETERKAAYRQETLYKAGFEQPQQPGKTDEVRKHTDISTHEHERVTINPSGKKDEVTTKGSGLREETKKGNTKEWNNQEYWNNTKGNEWSSSGQGKEVKTETGKQWESQILEQSKKGSSLLKQTEGNLEKTSDGHTWESSTTGYSKEGNWVEKTQGLRKIKEEGGYREQVQRIKYLPKGKMETEIVVEEVTPNDKGFIKNITIQRTNAAGKTETVEKEGVYVTEREAFRWHTEEQWKTSKGSSWNRDTTKEVKKDGNIEHWKENVKGSNSNGREWESQTVGQRKKDGNTTESKSETQGKDNQGTHWHKDRRSESVKDGDTTYHDHESKTVIHQGKQSDVPSKRNSSEDSHKKGSDKQQ